MQGPQGSEVLRSLTSAAQMISGNNGPMLQMITNAIDRAANGLPTFNVMALQALGTAASVADPSSRWSCRYGCSPASS